jgi:hypothetical protein
MFHLPSDVAEFARIQVLPNSGEFGYQLRITASLGGDNPAAASAAR